jgi:hypothetical protein
MTTIAKTLAALRVGTASSIGSLTMIPLERITAGTQFGTPDIVLLDAALRSGSFEVRETSDEGTVAQLVASNRGASAVLLVDGEEVVGAKQNRVFNLSILVPPHTDLPIPVSCVEAGRWRASSLRFAAAPRTQHASGRAERMSDVSGTLRDSGNRKGSQERVWRNVERVAARFDVRSPTAALSDVFAHRAVDIEQYVSALRPGANQVGAVFCRGGRAIAVELFDSPQHFTAALPKLVRSHALDALDYIRGADQASDSRSAVDDLLAGVVTARVQRFPAVGWGEDLRLSGQGIVGAALVYKDRVVHLAAFVLPNIEAPSEGGFGGK